MNGYNQQLDELAVIQHSIPALIKYFFKTALINNLLIRWTIATSTTF